MATYQEIYANARWFRAQIEQLEARTEQCRVLRDATECTAIDEDAWPSQLADFEAAYESARKAVSIDGKASYDTGVTRLAHLSRGLEATARAYLRAEAEAERTIRRQIQQLINEF